VGKRTKIYASIIDQSIIISSYMPNRASLALILCSIILHIAIARMNMHTIHASNIQDIEAS